MKEVPEAAKFTQNDCIMYDDIGCSMRSSERDFAGERLCASILFLGYLCNNLNLCYILIFLQVLCVEICKFFALDYQGFLFGTMKGPCVGLRRFSL